MEIESFAAPYTMVRALKSKLLKKSDYQSMLHFSGLEELFSYIRPHLIQKDPPDLTEDNFEIVLNYENAEVIRKVRIFLWGEPGEFLDLLNYRDYITRIEYIVHNLESGIEADYIEFFDRLWCRKPEDGVFHDFAGFISLVKSPELRNLIQSSYKSYLDGTDLLHFNVGLERRYFNYLFEFAEIFDTENLGMFKGIIGEFIEIEVLVWALRMNLRYHMSYEEIIPMIPSFNIFLTDNQFNRIISSGDIEIAYNTLKNSHYAKYFKYLKFGKLNIDNVLSEFDTKFRKELLSYFKGNPFSLGPILAYYILKRFETARIVSIAEAIKFGYKKDKLKEIIL